MRRYDIERAVDRAQLPGPSTGIMRALLARINAKTGAIPSAAQPSLSQLASLCGYDRSTIMRHLNTLEAAGWVIRIRPPAWLARTQHVTTAYAMQVPGGYAQARRRGEPRLAADREEARRATAQALAARDAEADRAASDPLDAPGDDPGRAAPPRTDSQTDSPTERGQTSSPGDEDLAMIAAEELRQLTGRAVTARDGAEAARLVLDGRNARNPAAYLRQALRSDPARYLPPASPPSAVPFSDLARLEREAIEKSGREESPQ